MAPKFFAVIVAAGRGVRFGRPKQLIDLAGHPLVSWSMQIFGDMAEPGRAGGATEEESVEAMRGSASAYARRSNNRVRGGATRQESVRNALRASRALRSGLRTRRSARVDQGGRRAGRDGRGQARHRGGPRCAGHRHDQGRAQRVATVAKTLDRGELWQRRRLSSRCSRTCCGGTKRRSAMASTRPTTSPRRSKTSGSRS